jgi:hypothetical protein
MWTTAEHVWGQKVLTLGSAPKCHYCPARKLTNFNIFLQCKVHLLLDCSHSHQSCLCWNPLGSEIDRQGMQEGTILFFSLK